MRRPATLAVRIIALLLATTAVSMAVAVLYGPASGSQTPYLSALSDVTLGTDALAAGCNTTCSFTNPPTCIQGVLHHHNMCTVIGTTCTVTTC